MPTANFKNILLATILLPLFRVTGAQGATRSSQDFILEAEALNAGGRAVASASYSATTSIGDIIGFFSSATSAVELQTGFSPQAPAPNPSPIGSGSIFSWIGQESVDWFNPTNWSQQSVPGVNDTVILSNGAMVRVDREVAVAHLNLSNGRLIGSGLITVNGVMNWTGGAMEGSGRTVIGPDAILNITNNAQVSLLGRTLENAGTVFWGGNASGVFLLDSGALVTNRAGGLWEARSDQTLNYGGNIPTARFDNAGTFRKTATTGTTTIGTPFNNYGTVEVQTGRVLANDFPFNQTGTTRVSAGAALTLSGGGTASNAFQADAGGLIEWRREIYHLNSGAALHGAGLYRLSGGTVNVNDEIEVENFHLLGTLAGPGQLTVTGMLDWGAGAMRGTGRTLIAPGALLNVTNSSDLFIENRMLENAGRVLVTGAGNWVLDSGAFLLNRAGAVWEVRNDQSWHFGGNGTRPRFENRGLWRKSSRGGVTAFEGLPLDNFGSVEVQAGTLRLSAGGEFGGTFVTAAAAAVEIADGLPVLKGGAQLGGAGVYRIARGPLTISGEVAVQNLDLHSTLTGDGTLTVNGTMNWEAGAMRGPGRTVIGPTAILNITNGTEVLLTERTLENAGTVFWNERADIHVDSGAVVTNRAGAIWETRSDRFFTYGGNGALARIDNAGLFAKTTTTGTTAISAGFNNYGAVEVRSGKLLINGRPFNQHGTARVSSGATLILAGGGTASGAFEADAGGLVEFKEQSYTLETGTQLEGDGVYRSSSGSVNVNGEVEVGNFHLLGTLGGSGVLTINNELDWGGGAMIGPGRTLIGPEAVLHITNQEIVSLTTRTLEIEGTAVWSGLAGLNAGEGAFIHNRPGAVWEVKNDQSFDSTGNGIAPRFENEGTFRKTGTSGTTTFGGGFAFDNSGVVEVQTGVLLLNGDYRPDADSVHAFILAGSSPGTGFGQLQVNGTATLAGSLEVELANSFLPADGAAFPIITATSLAGNFDRITGDVAAGLTLSPTPTGLFLLATEVTAPAPTFNPGFLRMVDGQFRMRLEGVGNQSYRVSASTDLIHWSPISTNVISASGFLDVADPESRTLPYRFYRLEQP